MNPNRTFIAARLLALCAICAAISVPSFSQPSNAIGSVQLALTQLSHGHYSAEGEKGLARNGDASAVAITKVFAGKTLTPAEISNIALVVKQSFEFLGGIENQEDREPRTALFLLNSLSHLTDDPKANADIRSASTFVQSQYSEYIKSEPAQ
ncbi:MAG: hypothetical protein WCC26_16290 [Terracidiphilus sp.]